MPERLLILKCSYRKRGDESSLIALDRYDSPLWRVLRRALDDRPTLRAEIDIYVLSAAFGLISASQSVPWSDQTMAPERADALRSQTLARFGVLVNQGYSDICLGLSHRYLRAILGWESL